MSYGIVKDHGGRTPGRKRGGKGIHLHRLYFPCSRRQYTRPRKPAKEKVVKWRLKIGDSQRVVDTLLIVDDEEDMGRLLKRALEPELGCEVRTAHSGEGALAILEKDPVGLVLLDVKMPGMDGLEVLERIRRDHPWLTVVMMTAHGSIELAVQAIKMGAYDFITKPFDHEALVWHSHQGHGEKSAAARKHGAPTARAANAGFPEHSGKKRKNAAGF